MTAVESMYMIDLLNGVTYDAGRRSGIVLVEQQPVGDVAGEVVVVCSQNDLSCCTA